MTQDIRNVAIIGTGVIGASWAALYLAKGLDVTATDVAPGAEARLAKYIDDAWPALEELGLAPGASKERWKFCDTLESAVSDVGLVQENGPERLDFKQKLYAQMDELLGPEVLIASSSSGLTMSAIQSACRRHPERCLIGHPFNPPHLIPLVELVAGSKTSPRTVQRAQAFYRSLGKTTIRLNKEVPGHVANRLQAALLREIVYLVSEGVVDVADVDAAVSWGPGLRWASMGPLLLSHLAGGAGGISHFFDQFTGPLTAWWAVLGSPSLDAGIRQVIADGVAAEAEGRSLEQLAAQRDAVLLGLLKLRQGETPRT